METGAQARRDWRMWAGVIGPVLFVATFLVEGAIRAGPDAMRLQVSYLSLGDGGLVQVAAFLATSLLLAVFAYGLRARLRASGGPGARAVPILVAAVAIGMLIAGLFSTVPAFGYPPGTPDGWPASVPTTAYVHVGGAFLIFGGMILAPVAMARRFRAMHETGWAVYSVGTAAIVAVAFAASSADPSGRPYVPEAVGLLQRISIIAGLGWIAAVAGLAPLDAPPPGLAARPD